MAEMLTALRRHMWKAPAASSARCMDPDHSCMWPGVAEVSAGRAGAAARNHTRQTGHQAWAIHRQIVSYARDSDGN